MEEPDKVLKSSKDMNFISLFSITMWIHLNHGDVGLKTFLPLSAQPWLNVVVMQHCLLNHSHGGI